MKKYIVLILMCISSLMSYSQTDSMPSYFIVNKDTLGILLSIEQAQRVDNDLELLELLESMKVGCDSAIKQYVVVVDGYKKKVAILNITIDTLSSIGNDQNRLISNLNTQILNYKEQIKLADSQIDKKDKIISNDKIMLRKANRWKYIGIGGIISFGFLVMSILK